MGKEEKERFLMRFCRELVVGCEKCPFFSGVNTWCWKSRISPRPEPLTEADCDEALAVIHEKLRADLEACEKIMKE